MTPDRWQRIKDVFDSAMERTPGERGAYLDKACGNDRKLRREVESLIASAESNNSFMERPAVSEAMRAAARSHGRSVVGRRISHYEILAPLGRGGMGEVYLARDIKLGRKVALKLLNPDFAKNTDHLRRFEQEAAASSALNHPNIITIYEVDKVDDIVFIAAEHISGVTLRDHMTSQVMSLQESFDVAVQIGSALAAAHQSGIVHRDVKPENVMIRRDRLVKVLDFGLVKLIERPGMRATDSEVLTRRRLKTNPGAVMGTVQYMTPEQARGLPVDARTDIWSLGVVLYEMISGRVPFEGATPTDVIIAIAEREPATLTHQTQPAPVELQRLVQKALRKRSGERYQTIEELLLDLQSLRRELDRPMLPAAGEGTKASGTLATGVTPTASTAGTPPRNASSAEHSMNNVRRYRRGAMAMLAALFVALGAIAYVLFRPAKWNSEAENIYQRVRLTRLTSTGQVNEIGAAVSPDGKYVAYAVENAGQQSLRLRQPVSNSDVEIIPPANVKFGGISFSHDSNYIYYVMFNVDSSVGHLYRTSILGLGSVKMIAHVTSPVAVSRDGSRLSFIRFHRGAGRYELVVAKADGTQERVIATRQGGQFFSLGGVAWSPNDEALACAEGSYSNGLQMSVVEIEAASGAEKHVGSQSWFQVYQLAWLADGKGLMITAKEQSVSPFQVWHISYPGGEVRRITNSSNDFNTVSLTADATTLVTVQAEQLTDIWVSPIGETGRAKRVNQGVGLSYGLCWSANGKVYYSSMANGSLDIWAMEADGNDRKQLTFNAGANYHPAASADGRHIVFTSNRTGTFNIWKMDADGSNPLQLTGGGNDFHPSFSRDGQWVVYVSFADGVQKLWKVKADGGAPVQLTDTFSTMPVVSPDGKFIACRYSNDPSNKQRVAIIPFEGGRPSHIYDIPIHEWQQIRWTTDGRAITYFDVRDGVSNVWSQTLDGGPPKQLTDFKSDRIFSYDWSPDGKHLVCERGKRVQDVAMMRW